MKNLILIFHRKATKEEIINYFTKTEEEFVLPDKWCVKITKENYVALNEYRRVETEIVCKSVNHGYYLSRRVCAAKWGWWEYNPDGHVEITFEQFKKHVLKQEIMEKKIIGYKVPYDITVGGTWKKGEICIKNPSLSSDNYNYVVSGFRGCLPKEIVETWEPVYEEEKKEKEFTLRSNRGTFNLIVRKDGFFYKPDNKVLTPEFIINQISSRSTQDRNQYTFTSYISHLSMGCKEMVPVEDIIPLIDYWKELNK